MQKEERKDVLNELSMKETLKEALEKIAHVYEFGMGAKKSFCLAEIKDMKLERLHEALERQKL